MSFIYREQWPLIAKQVDAMRIMPSRRIEFIGYVKKYWEPNKARYEALALRSGVPAVLLFAMHFRESTCDFDTYYGNGDPLGHVTVNVPEGRGPFHGPHAFEDSAMDALAIDHLLDVVPPWHVEKMIFHGIRLNGIGYDSGPFIRGTSQRHPPMPSPYAWGGTNIQRDDPNGRGKYTRDRYFDPDVWDMQPGIAPLMWTVGSLDSAVAFTRES